MKWLMVACVAVLAVAIAFTPETKQSDRQAESSYQPLMPELKTHINDVDRISVSRGEEQITVYMDSNQQWRVKEAADYPASSVEIRKLLLYLSQSELRDKKTANPELLPRLKLDAPQAFTLTLWDGEEQLHQLLLGKLTPEKSATYVRTSADDLQSYTATGQLVVSANPLDWLFYDLFSVKINRVRSVEYNLEGHKSYRYSRETPDVQLTLSDLPEDKELKQRYQIVSPAAFVEKLNFTEVVPREKADGEALGNVTVTTFDGLKILFTLYRVEFENHFAISALADKSIYKQVSEDMQDFSVTQQEAAAINDRTRGWLYKLGQYHTNQLTKSYFDIVQDKQAQQGSEE